MFITVLFIITKVCKQPKCPQAMDEDVVYIYNKILFSYKNEILPFATTWM